MTIESQSGYWNRVANEKVFTHPIELSWLDSPARANSLIVDYGCGYGRMVKILSDAGYCNVVGFDTSAALIERGKKADVPNVFLIEDPNKIPLEEESADCILLFAVLTCIPSNKGQTELISLLQRKLRKGGILYISDYYLQEKSTEGIAYAHLDNDLANFGVFSLPEGATFRHHTKEWIDSLLEQFETEEEMPIDVLTMNGHKATAFQRKCRKK